MLGYLKKTKNNKFCEPKRKVSDENINKGKNPADGKYDKNESNIYLIWILMRT